MFHLNYGITPVILLQLNELEADICVHLQHVLEGLVDLQVDICSDLEILLHRLRRLYGLGISLVEQVLVLNKNDVWDLSLKYCINGRLHLLWPSLLPQNMKDEENIPELENTREANENTKAEIGPMEIDRLHSVALLVVGGDNVEHAREGIEQGVSYNVHEVHHDELLIRHREFDGGYEGLEPSNRVEQNRILEN